jgi:hypothetical protein
MEYLLDFYYLKSSGRMNLATNSARKTVIIISQYLSQKEISQYLNLSGTFLPNP